jgi:putative ABC transport system permease protein
MGRLAARGVVASLSRTAVAIAALMVAVATALGVGLMVGSFRQTVVRWLETSLVADVYVSAPGPVGSRPDATLAPEVAARLARAPGIVAVGTYRRVEVRSAGGPTQLVALGTAAPSRRQFRFLEGAPAEVWSAFEDGGAAIVSEPYAYRRGLRVGSTLRLGTDRGERELPVAGVFADYGSDQGVVMVSRQTYEALWDDRGVSSLGLFAAPGKDVDALVAELRRLAGPGQAVLVRSNRALRESSLAIFDRTFAVTAVLRVLALVVAFVGVLSALMALQLERARELAVLRAQGLTPGQVWGVVTIQTGLMGLVAGLLAVPVGMAMALVLVFVINRRSFGWTLELALDPLVLAQGVGVALVAAALAGVYPAYRMARTPPALALREE